jgi:hypothetical protein
MRRSGFANGPVNKAHLHVIPHRALGQVGEGAEFIKTESFGHGSILTPKLFKSSVNIEMGQFNWGQININFVNQRLKLMLI